MLHILQVFGPVMDDAPAPAPAPCSPQEQLLATLLDGDLRAFRRLLAHPAVNPTHKYGKPHFGTCLELACRLPQRHDFVKELLTKVKPNVNFVVPEPIHYAAARGHVETLELLLKDKRTKISAQDSAGRTALHYATKNFPEGEAAARFERCVELLLQHPSMDADRPSYKGFTALHEAAAAPGGKAAVQAMLRHARRPLDLDGVRAHGRTARDAILLKYPELREALSAHRKASDSENAHLQAGALT